MEVNIVGDVANLVSVDGNLVREHARCRDLYGIVPVVVTETKIVCEVKDSLLAKRR